METIISGPIMQYDFTEKNFLILPEWRIRRRQYITRLIAAGILLGVLLWGIGMMLQMGSIENAVIDFVTNAALIIGVYIIWYTLNSKRIRDIGKNPKVVQMITMILIGVSVINSLYHLTGMQGWISWYVQPLDALFGAELPWHQTIVGYVMYAYGIVAVWLFLYLFLIPGKTGDNEFGKDPMGTKLGFFG